jgi:hypothetical protein
MVQIWLLFACGISLSFVAAFYAVNGLIAIFAASATAIAVMGGLLEVSKLVTASWLYNNWRSIPLTLKTYFSIALVILMVLTSMGIFGYLSKAHLDQAVPTGDVVSKLALIDEKIKVQRDTIANARAVIQQMDDAVTQTMARTDDAKGAERALQIRRSQARDRSRLTQEIETAQAEITKLNEQRAPIASEVRKVEAEVGPIKYIAALIYGDELNETLLESAVRIVIIMIIVVFDPLAVLLLIAANFSLNKERNNEHPKQVLEVANRSSIFNRKPTTEPGKSGRSTWTVADGGDRDSPLAPKQAKASRKKSTSKKSTSKNAGASQEASDSEATSKEETSNQAQDNFTLNPSEIVKETKQQGDWQYTVYRDKFTEKDPFSELKKKYVKPKRS